MSNVTPPDPVDDNIFKAALIGLILRAKSLNLTREAFVAQCSAAWEMADKHQPTVAKISSLWDAIKAESRKV